MPKVYGPLHSDQARKQFAKTLIFQQHGLRSTVKAYAVPKNPRSLPQRTLRAKTKRIMQAWTDLDPSAQASWTTPAAAAGVGPNILFFQTNFARDTAGLGILAYHPGPYGHRIYHGGTVTPQLALWITTPDDPTLLTLINGEIFADPQITNLEPAADTALDGQFDFRALDHTTTIALGNGPEAACLITQSPLVAGNQSLRGLQLDGCPIQDWPDLTGCTNFRRADWSNDGSEGQNPDPPSFPTTIETILLDGRGILSMPDLTGCAHLTELALGGPVHTPTSLADCIALQLFDASNTDLTAPPTLTNLPALIQVNFQNSSLAQPPDFTGSTSLQTFTAQNTALAALPTFSNYAALKNVDLTNCHLAAGQPDALFNALYAAWGDTPVDTSTHKAKTPGATNAVVTSASLTARNALTAAGWYLTYRT